MNKTNLLVVAFGFYFAACSGKPSINNTNATSEITAAIPVSNDTFPIQKIISHINCNNDPSQSFALYLPLQYNKQQLPVIYFFDPHADGALPLKNYKTLADNYGFILIGSNNSKNGNDFQTAENTWNTLFDDAQNRLSFNHQRIYVCGFSGGAKVASFIALHHKEILGVIANSAGLPDETPAGNFNFSFTGLAGRGDMNMTDVVALNNALDNTSTIHHLILFDGKHEWAPQADMNIAFEALAFDAMKKNLTLKNDSLINEFAKQSRQSVTDDVKSNDLIKAVQQCTLSAGLLNGLSNEANWFNSKEAFLKNEAVYKQQLQQQQQLFSVEQSKKTEYQQQFQQADVHYWTTTISNLQASANPGTQEGEMYQRLLAYLSLSFYSISNNLINNNQNEPAQYFVNLYKLADSTNNEAWYFSAILNARNNNAAATQNDLMKAAALGFNDVNRMMQQPEFQKLPGINLNAIQSEMNAK